MRSLPCSQLHTQFENILSTIAEREEHLEKLATQLYSKEMELGVREQAIASRESAVALREATVKETSDRLDNDRTAMLQQQQQIPRGRRVKLDVGGHLFSTTLDTLTAFPDSMLGVMFGMDSAWVCQHEEDGSVFIDREGQLFHWILSWLRAHSGGATRFSLPEDDATRRALLEEAAFYNLPLLMEALHPGSSQVDCEYRCVFTTTPSACTDDSDLRSTTSTAGHQEGVLELLGCGLGGGFSSSPSSALLLGPSSPRPPSSPAVLTTAVSITASGMPCGAPLEMLVGSIREAQGVPGDIYIDRGDHDRPFMLLDFGEAGAVLPTHYTLLNGGGAGCRMISWVLEGGYRECGPWDVLHRGSQDVFHGQPHGTAHFELDAGGPSGTPYRFVRLTQLSNLTTNSSMYLSRLELFGSYYVEGAQDQVC